ncbi:hypothetical protein [Streptomyces sp. NPDC055189]
MPNEIIRHPRLSSDAVRLLTWQLSLPADAKDSLSRTAERAGIGKCAFLRAKRELKAEGYFHEWREQGLRGRWTTRQLVSSVSLSGADAASVRDGDAAADPTVGEPAAGGPIGRAVGRLPKGNPAGNTFHPPVEAEAEAEGEGVVSVDAFRVVEELHLLDPRLRVPRGMLPHLAVQAAEWLRLGHSVEDVRDVVRRGLPAFGQEIHHPGGLVRHLLRCPSPSVAVPPETEPRVARMRECAGKHTQPYLFLPVAEEDWCPACGPARAESAVQPQVGSGTALTRGVAAVRAALCDAKAASGRALQPLTPA